VAPTDFEVVVEDFKTVVHFMSKKNDRRVGRRGAPTGIPNFIRTKN
jgi:hypothetical protein